jgi:hypothetical protein
MDYKGLIKNIATNVRNQMASTAVSQNVFQIRPINIYVNIAVTR